MVSIYLVGHNYEFEIKNVYRIFDLNQEIKVYYDNKLNFDCSKLVVLSEFIESNNSYWCKTTLYIDSKEINHITIYKNDIVLEKDDDKKHRKTVVKKSLYKVLSSYFNENTEYGFLTGIRPNKILAMALKNNMTRENANLILKNTYEVSDNKIKLLNEIYDSQIKYMQEDENIENYNLYIHIPFCPSRCIYCSFVSYSNYNQEIIDEYVKNLMYEVEETIKLAISSGLKLNTIYFGGGTPSVLSTKNINDIFSVIKRYYDLKDVNEITFEAGRPDTIDEEKLQCLKDNYVGRISINPQTMNHSTLQKISRNHTVKDIEDTFYLAKKVGFNSINMDLIIGLPGETPEDVLISIIKIIALQPDNITIHALSYKKGSSLISKVKTLSRDTDTVEEMYQITRNVCRENGYKPYYMYRQKNIKGNLDNVGYALGGKESIYNIVIIEEVETILACGIGAVSKILMGNNRHERVQNYKDLVSYNSNIQKNINDKILILNNGYNNFL